MLAHDLGIGVGQGRLVAILRVGNAKAAAEIHMLDGVAVGAQGFGQLRQQSESIVKGLQLGDLAADMHVDAGHFQARKLGGPRIGGAGVLPADAELVLRLAGGDLPVRFRVDIRVDAQRDIGRQPQRGGARRKLLELGHRFDVEAEDAGLEREVHFARGLADTGKQDLAGRHACGQRTAQLAFGDHIHACAEAGERGQNGLVGVRLHGVADERIQPLEGFREDTVMTRQRCRGIAVERGTDGFRDGGHRHVFGVQDAVTILEMIHGRILSTGRLDAGLRRRAAQALLALF